VNDAPESNPQKHDASDGFTTKRFVLIFASIFALGSMPLLLQQPSGGASAGLSLGFTMPIESMIDLAILAAVGLYASSLRAQATLLIPLSFLFLYVAGSSIALDTARYALMPMFLFGSVMLFALSVAIAGRRSSLLAMLVAASIGFHFGRKYIEAVPDIASPLYFMIGNILSFALILATAISFGLIFRSSDSK